MGMDDLDAGSAMPIIKILQKTSAEVDETHAKYDTKKIPGAKSGDLLYLADSELLGSEVEILPISQKSLYAEWRPQNQGGGLVAHHPLSVVTDPNYKKGGDGNEYKEFLGANELVMTIYFFVMFKSTEAWKQGIIAFTSSNLKHARAFAKQLRSFRYEDTKQKPFIFSRSFMLKTKLNRKNNNSWFEFDITPERILDFKEDKDLLEVCVESYQQATQALPDVSAPKQLDTDDESEPF